MTSPHIPLCVSSYIEFKGKVLSSMEGVVEKPSMDVRKWRLSPSYEFVVVSNRFRDADTN